MLTIYGIKNCDTVKKARKWLENNGVDYQFHDFREDGLKQSQVKLWLDELGWENLINKRSTSWKALSEETKASLDNESAAEVILETPTLIKRPLADNGKQRIVGFKEATYNEFTQ